MKNLKSMAGFVILSCSILNAPVAFASQPHDAKVVASVKSLLIAEKDIPSADISVSVKDDIVKLSGLVDTQLQLNRAVEIAQSVDGVNSVDDSDLRIKDSSNYLKDAAITAKAKGKIMQLANQKRIGKDYDLHVETTNGVVHIFGKVARNKDKSIIKDNIGKMDDVKQVNINIS